jgi:hypothetical protein
MKVVLSLAMGALLGLSYPALTQPTEVAPGVVQLGTLQNPNVTESSGVVSSRRLRGTFWTHNDGGAAVLYAFTTNGIPVSEWTVADLDTHDWEDIAWSGGRIYIADIGNSHGTPGDIYVVAEPNPRKSGTLHVLKHWELEYPDEPFNSESFFVSRGFGYLIEKENGHAHVYRFKLVGRTAGQLEKQCSLNTDSEVTGADITRDNKRLGVITDDGAYLFLLPKAIPEEGTLEPALFVPYELDGMEGCAFTRDGLLVTAESGVILMFTDPMFHAK